MRITSTALAALLLLAFCIPAIGHSGSDHDQGHAPSPSPGPGDAVQTPKPARNSPGKGKVPHAPVEAYKPGEMRGWTLHIEQGLLDDKALHKKVMDELNHQLYLVEVAVPQDKVQLLKKVPIWIDLANPYAGGAQYHPSKRWLEDNGYLPQKAQAVEISNARNFVRHGARHEANTMLHELAHAFHHQHLDFNHPDVIAAYQKVKAAGTYDKVTHIGGRKVRHYALTNHKEYFAECTEAFFGANDFYPFVRPELKEADPEGYKVVRELWGVKR